MDARRTGALRPQNPAEATLEERVVRLWWQQRPKDKETTPFSDAASESLPPRLPHLLPRLRKAPLQDCSFSTSKQEFFSPCSLHTPATSICGSQSPRPPTTHPVAGPLNSIVEHLWPRVSAYANEVIIKDVQPAVQAALPAALHGLRFDTERCHLGHQPLDFRELQIVKERQRTPTGEIENLVFQARVEWLADCSVVLNFAGASVGIRGLSFKGELFLKLVGLMDRPPFFKGIRAYFSNPPEMDLDFQGAAKELLNYDVVRHKILDVIESQICKKMVLPNCIGYGIVPDADIFSIKSPPPEGTLTLTVWSARNLLPMDIPVCSWFGSLNSDPYVQIGCGSYTFRSPTKYKTLSPEFAFTVTVPIMDAATQRFQLKLFDEDLMSTDDFLGRRSLPVQQMMGWGSKRRVTLELFNEAREKGKNGTVTISAEWRSALHEPGRPSSTAAGLVFAGVQSASQVPCLGEAAQYWVELHCTGLQPGFSDGPRVTGKSAPVEVKSPSEEKSQSSKLSLQSKTELLRSHGVSEQSIAEVLDVDVEALRRCSATSARARREVKWDAGFELPVQSLSQAELRFELHGKSSSSAARVLGTYRCSTRELAAEGVHRSGWRTVALEGCGAQLRLKVLGWRLGEATPGSYFAV